MFPKMRPGFKKVEEVFNLIAPAAKSISLQSLKDQASKIGVDSECEGMKEVLAVASLEGRTQLAANEFILFWTIVYLVDQGKGVQYEEIKTALDIVEKAFTYFDSSSDGFLERPELVKALQSGTKQFGSTKTGTKAQKSVAERLFDVLDDDGSGRVSFKEFLLGMQKIVMSEEMAEEDEELRQLTEGNS